MANVLIVDDEEMDRVLEAKIIEDAGHTPFFAGHGEAAMTMYKENDIDLVITDLRKPMGIIANEAGLPEPHLTKFRHTYATARLQTTDGGKQIALWTVAKELGHKNVSRVEDTYGHPNHYRPRGEVVEYRVEE